MTVAPRFSLALRLSWLGLPLLFGAAPAPRPLQPKAILEECSNWTAPQFVQADKKGNVFFLRAAALQSFGLQQDGLTEPVALLSDRRQQEDRETPRLRAAMDAYGGWALWEGKAVRWFHDGKEVPLAELEFAPQGVAFVKDELVAAVEPFRITPKPKWKLKGNPLVLRWNGKNWETLIDEPLPAKAQDPRSGPLREQRFVHLLGDSRGSLWVASCNLYRLRRYSAAGKLKEEVRLGKDDIRQRPDAESAQKAFAAKFQHWGRQVSTTAATARPVIASLSEGRDGRIYLLVHKESKGFTLDRYDPVTQTLERAPIALDFEGYISMAAGKDALYFAPYNPAMGRWRLPWEDLEAAPWAVVKRAKISGGEPARAG